MSVLAEEPTNISKEALMKSGKTFIFVAWKAITKGDAAALLPEAVNSF